jgi:uncharacterized radical SAM protein YgiQ
LYLAVLYDFVTLQRVDIFIKGDLKNSLFLIWNNYRLPEHILMKNLIQTSRDIFLPVTKADLLHQGIDRLDVILVTGDAYVDHPAFGAAMVGRFIQSLGFSVGIIAMPNVNKPEDFTALGEPRYFFGVTAGNVDSMLSLFTAQKKPRSDDPYVPGGKAGARPQRATIAYCNMIRRCFKGVPIIIGGVEASLRRIAHYDFWSDSIRQPISLDAKADMLVYGMAENPLREILSRIKQNILISDMHNVPGTAVTLGASDIKSIDKNRQLVELPSFEALKGSKQEFSAMTRMFYEHQYSELIQKSGTRAVLVNSPAKPLSHDEIDSIYELPFTYQPHPAYSQSIPAFEQIKDSIVTLRGCFGGCNFCGLGAHQGKTIQSRSSGSIIREIKRRAFHPGWKGIVSDLGGPTANMYGLSCKRPSGAQPCLRRSCLFPEVCGMLDTDQSCFTKLIESVSSLAGVKHLSINSGIRMDLGLLSPEVIKTIARKATGGLLSVAPEHVVPGVLNMMGKPEDSGWEEFEKIFMEESRRLEKKQFLVPYLIAGHPGSTEEDARKLGQYLKQRGIKVRQVQEFIPIPTTVSSSMYVTGEDPFTRKPVYVTRKLSEVRRQKELIMWWNKL